MEVLEILAESTPTNLTQTGGVGQAILNLDRLVSPKDRARVVILGWWQQTNGATIFLNLPRTHILAGAATAFANEGNTEAIKSAVNQTEPLFALGVVDETGAGTIQGGVGNTPDGGNDSVAIQRAVLVLVLG